MHKCQAAIKQKQIHIYQHNQKTTKQSPHKTHIKERMTSSSAKKPKSFKQIYVDIFYSRFKPMALTGH